MERVSGQCRKCLRWYVLRADGSMKIHRVFQYGPMCKGSGFPPSRRGDEVVVD